MDNPLYNDWPNVAASITFVGNSLGFCRFDGRRVERQGGRGEVEVKEIENEEGVNIARDCQVSLNSGNNLL